MFLRHSLIALTALGVLACQQPHNDEIGRQMEVSVDLGRHGNSVAFWSGTTPNDVLAVISRDRRTPPERAAGEPAPRALDLPASGVVTLKGTIERAPAAETTYSWRLTRQDAQRLAEKGVYLRLHQVVP